MNSEMIFKKIFHFVYISLFCGRCKRSMKTLSRGRSRSSMYNKLARGLMTNNLTSSK